MPYYFKPIILDRGDYTTATINLFGATITSWRIKNKEILFSPQTVIYDGLKPIYGGLKITFPYFGYSNHGPKHGFSRFVLYKVEEPPTKTKNGDIHVTIAIDNNKFTEAICHIKFKITIQITLGIDSLDTSVSVKNTCQYFPMYFAIMRYVLVKVDNIRKCQFVGMKEQGFVHLANPSEPLRDWDDAIECSELSQTRLYDYVPEEVWLTNISDSKQMIFIQTGEPVELIISNPVLDPPNTSEQCSGIAMGKVMIPVRLEPCSEWTFSGDIIVLDEEEERKKRRLQNLNLLDYVSKFC